MKFQKRDRILVVCVKPEHQNFKKILYHLLVYFPLSISKKPIHNPIPISWNSMFMHNALYSHTKTKIENSMKSPKLANSNKAKGKPIRKQIQTWIKTKWRSKMKEKIWEKKNLCFGSLLFGCHRSNSNPTTNELIYKIKALKLNFHLSLKIRQLRKDQENHVIA